MEVFITENAENAENTEGLQRPITPTEPGFDRRAPSAHQEINRLCVLCFSVISVVKSRERHASAAAAGFSTAC
jgi:hypothetical protein